MKQKPKQQPPQITMDKKYSGNLGHYVKTKSKNNKNGGRRRHKSQKGTENIVNKIIEENFLMEIIPMS